MKRIIGLLTLLFCGSLISVSTGQTAEEILTSSLDSLKRIKTIQYQVQYQFSNGSDQEKNLTASITEERYVDTLFGMKFIFSTDSSEYIYDGRFAFEINHKRREVKQINPAILKKNKINDLLIGEIFQGYGAEAYSGYLVNSEIGLKYYSIAYSTDNVNGKTFKKVYIDRSSGIPERFESVFENHGKKEVTLLTLNEITINAKNAPRADTRIMAYIDKYTLLPIEDIGIKVSIDARDSLIGKEAPDFLLNTTENKSIKLSDFKGQMVLLDFWEVWCGPCRMSLPHLQELNDKYKGKELVILGITKDNLTAAKSLLLNKKVTYDNLVGNSKVSQDYKVLEIPQYYLIDKNGIIIFATKNGFEQKMEDMIEERSNHP
jgi:peroxiredoxin/outer membrane lipoprotein-sorting protein